MLRIFLFHGNQKNDFLFASQFASYLRHLVKVAATHKNILALALPISFALLIPQLSFLANTIFLGRYGERELAVNGVAGVFYLTISMIGYGLSSGIQIQLARRAGEGDQEGLTKSLANGISLSLLGSLTLMLLSLWLAPLIFGFSLSDANNAQMSINYLFIRVWGLPFLLLTQQINAFFIATNRSRFLIYGSLSGTLTNILFDYLLIFGQFDFPRLGINGAAIASILGELAYCFVMFSLFFGHRFQHQYPLRRFLSFDLSLSKRSLRIASPLIVQYLFSIGGWQVFFIFVEHLGTRQLAASQILRSIFGVIGIGTWAMAATCNTMVSNIIGQGRQEEVLSLIRKVAKLSLIYTLVVSTILFVFADQFLLLYRDDPILVHYAKPSMVVIIIATLIMAISTVVFNGVVGTGNTLVNLSIEITSVVVYLVYCYLVIQRLQLSLAWAWGSEFVYWSILLILAILYLRSGKWKGKII
ncbi:MAG: MATE family efflux transporter [Bacteroidetes bacterium]|nr:MATE family efflux transporter [Bacteroidota bacterium]MBS1741018.1 MATE family efflux transporter [Bacteroidota bacterium]